MHEIAVVSGFSAAYRLGAKYPYADDAKCKRLFSLYMLLSQGKRMVSLSLSFSIRLLTSFVAHRDRKIAQDSFRSEFPFVLLCA